MSNTTVSTTPPAVKRIDVSGDMTKEQVQDKIAAYISTLNPAQQEAACDELALLPCRTEGGHKMAMLRWLINRLEGIR